MRIAELPQAIRTAISDWRLWVTLSLPAAVIINETVAGIRDGLPIALALTRLPLYKVFYLLLVSSILAQAGIGAVPFIAGGFMTLYDIALARRRRWKEEGIEEGRKATQAQAERSRAEADQARAEAEPAGTKARETFLREKINAVLADPTLTPESKNHVIGILTADTEVADGRDIPDRGESA